MAAFLAGSHATGTSDAYSDLDLGVITTQEAFADVVADRRALISQFGDPLFLDHFYRDQNVFFILADGTEGEIFFGHEGALEEIDVGPFEPLLDRRGILIGAQLATFCPMERQAMLQAALDVVGFFREHAPRVATAYGSEYPTELARLMSDRLDELAIRVH